MSSAGPHFTDPEAYETLMGRWSRLLAPLFLEFAGAGRGPILDVGCGTGSLAVALAAQLGSEAVIGIDPAEAYVRHGRAMHPDLRLEVGDATALRFADRTFESALSLLVLNFIPDYRRAAMEMVRVTRPGGLIAAAVWDFEGGLMMARIFWETAAQVVPEARSVRARVYSAPLSHEGELAQLFRDLNLDEVREGHLTIWMRFADFEDYWRSFTGGQATSGSFLAGLSEPTRRRFRAALRENYCGGRDDGSRSFAATARAARGRAPVAAPR